MASLKRMKGCGAHGTYQQPATQRRVNSYVATCPACQMANTNAPQKPTKAQTLATKMRRGEV